jgi:hypothetical protein
MSLLSTHPEYHQFLQVLDVTQLMTEVESNLESLRGSLCYWLAIPWSGIPPLVLIPVG